MAGIYDLVRGSVLIKAVSPTGTDRTAEFADRLAESIKFSGLKSENGTVTVTVSERDREFVLSCADELGMSGETVSQRGLYYIIRRYVGRVGIYIGIILSLALILFLSNIVMRIEISGNETVSDDELLSLMYDCGIRYGAFIPSINFRKAEKQVQSSSDKLAWVGIRHSGFRVIAEVSEAAEVPEVISKNQPSNIISMYDAQITSISVHSGMLMPMLGDTVRKGEILISGVVSKKFEGTYNVRALGEIIGQYRSSVTFTQPYEDEVTSYGEPFVNSYLTLFGKSMAIPPQTVLTGKYEFEQSTEYISFLGLTLPAAVTRVEIFPYTIENTVYSEAQAEEIISEKIAAYENNFLTDGTVSVIDKNIKRTSDENGITVTAEYLLEGNIGIEKPFFPLKS